jgi:hypothetical protein
MQTVVSPSGKIYDTPNIKKSSDTEKLINGTGDDDNTVSIFKLNREESAGVELEIDMEPNISCHSLDIKLCKLDYLLLIIR